MQGSIFVIESGTDGSGKATQTKLLYDRLKADGYKVIKVSYPNYESDSSALVKMYLRRFWQEGRRCRCLYSINFLCSR